MYMPEQNDSSYFLCNIHTIIFSTKTYGTHLPYPSYEFLISTCCVKLGVSAFEVLPHRTKQGILYYQSLFWTELLD